MKRITLLALVLIAHLSLCAQTFTVDGKLPLPPEKEGSRHLRVAKGDDIANRLNRDYTRSDAEVKVIASSYGKDGLCLVRHDAFFNCFVTAFAEHRPLVLSPDMIWLIINQGFSHYVSLNSELFSDKLNNAGAKFNLVVDPGRDMLAPNADWTNVLNEFTGQIHKTCKPKVANNMTASFSTSKPAERIATQITMMDGKSIAYEYETTKMACGIPSITLEGSTEDWQKVLDKTMQLEQYGLRWWTSDLKTILKEFINASKGKPTQWFWQGMVMRRKPNQLSGDACSNAPATMLDGWFLKFFPFDQNGRTPATVPHFTRNMLPELQRVSFEYRQNKTKSIPMELWAGFIGAEEDPATYAIRPKIGWIVIEAENEVEERFKIKKMNDEERVLIVREVPDVLRRVGHLGKIKLKFKEEIQLPDWFNELNIDIMILEGTYSDATVAQILSMMPQYTIKANASSITLTKMRR